MNDLVLVCAGGLGKETLFQLHEINKQKPAYRILGFVDDNEQLHGREIHGVPVIGATTSLLQYNKETSVCLCAGSPFVRNKLYQLLRVNPNLSFPSIIAPNVIMSEFVQIGRGSIIAFSCVLTADIVIGDFVLVSNACTIGHDAQLGDYATLYPAVNISGAVKIGEYAQVGVGSQILQGISIGAESFIGAGSVVLNNVEPGCTAVGVPAKIDKQKNKGAF